MCCCYYYAIYFEHSIIKKTKHGNGTGFSPNAFAVTYQCYSIIVFRTYTLYVLANDGVVKQPTSVAVVCSSLSCRRFAAFADLPSVFAVAYAGVRGLNMAPCGYLSWCMAATVSMQSVVNCAL